MAQSVSACLEWGKPSIMDTTLQLNTLWVLICTALAFFMQAGFCCLESGLSRSKNSINVAMKNIIDICIAGTLFWLFGYGLMFGDSWFGWFGWFGFNGGSILSLNESVPKVLINTFLAAITGGLTALLRQTLTKKIVSVECVMNGVLAGLVAITASCHLVSVAAAVFIGVTASLVMQFGTYLLEQRFRIDDVVGAIPVHGSLEHGVLLRLPCLRLCRLSRLDIRVGINSWSN